MRDTFPLRPGRTGLEILRTELPDLAYELERQGRLDAADVVMMLHARLRELAPGPAADAPADLAGPRPTFQPQSS
ncbi:hypothetical protein Verru16b_03073 [Lacunisphaera limnophila]|uniref:Uncharacterized protein n=1 Tax=Lacunisphaera limnophila TaxID=1838286 RepID=A0A1D8AYL1_9BACT|nr:hypothetical protein [Lacunisphaera limnophila]AOS45982.1 hypothetical protein Verru16b_03073 [Lacunisphaera limnophila]